MINLAGTPPTMVFAGTSFVTTAPAATIAPSPIVIPGRIVALEPIQTFLPITIGAGCIVPLFSGAGAAKILNVTQPTLSKQLMELEEELGKKLLIRGNRRITLTEEGALLRKRAQEIMELVDKTESEISSKNEVISGDVYIGGGETDSMRLIA